MTDTTSADDSRGSGEDRKLVGADRTLAVLSELALHPEGVRLEELASAVASPKPTVHRALVALRRAGFAAQDGHGRYLLGSEFLRLAFLNHEGRPDHVRISGALKSLSEQYGETIHYTVLDGDAVVYRAKEDPLVGSVRLTSVVGGRNPAHCTAAGKLLLSFQLPDRQAIEGWMQGRSLVRQTPASMTTLDELDEEFTRIRTQGYAVDDQENEPGINCFAVPAFLASADMPTGAVSVSALAYRTPLAKLVDDHAAIVESIQASLRGDFPLN